MQEIIDLITITVGNTKFDAGRSGVFSPEGLRTVTRRDNLIGGMTAASAQAMVPQHLLEKLTQKLRPVLEPYIEPESDRIGNGLVLLMGGLPQPTTAEFARVLVRAAAILGAERTAELMLGWIHGEPLFYRIKALLSGVTVDQTLQLEEGIRTTPLPKSSNELSAHLPALSMSIHGFNDFLRGVMLSIDCQAEPALYRPTGNGALPLSNAKHTYAQGKITGLTLDTFCEALSLACNHCIRWKYHWRDFGDLTEFNSGVGSGISYTDVPTMGSRVNLSLENLEQARAIHLMRHNNGGTRREIDRSIARWMKSKRSNTSLPDCFIELRVALEALYLKGSSAELRFRLAANGAWHLGSSFEERLQCFNTLRDTYDLASKAVHAVEVESTLESRKLLANAQDLCRTGILKRLGEKEEPKWHELILGVEVG